MLGATDDSKRTSRVKELKHTIKIDQTVKGYSEAQTVAVMYRNSRSGLWGVCIYLAVTCTAYHFKELSLATVLPGYLMQKLGMVPPVFMAVILLWISTLSALIVIAGRLFHNTEPVSTRSQLAFRIGFYLLFFVVGGLGEWFNELFVSGLLVLALQHYNVMSYYTKAIDTNLAVCAPASQQGA